MSGSQARNRGTKAKGSGAVKVLATLCILLLICCLVAFFQLRAGKDGTSEFETALALAQQHKFAQAKEALKDAPAILPDKKELSDYIEAGVLLEQGNFEGAKSIFQSLDYLDSGAMAQECDYRHAQRLVEQGAYEEAQTLFKSLGDYNESAQWMQECTYRRGIDEYEKLLETQDYGEICNIGERALALFRSISGHVYSEEMIERTCSYLYTMAIQAFNTASLTYNQPVQPEEGEAEENGGTDGATSPDIQSEQAQSVFDDARRLFSILEGYQESGRYLELLSVIMDAPQEQVGNSLLPMWNFEPVRKFLLGRYISDFFHGKWSGEGYDITFDDETYRYYLLSLESEQNYGSGTILKKGKKGWEMAYSFRILDENSIEIIGKKEYALQRVKEQTNSEGDSEEIAANSV